MTTKNINKKIMKCNLCNYEGDFMPMGTRLNARCPRCKSLERHRALAKVLKLNYFDEVYHVAPNSGLIRYLEDKCIYRSGHFEEGVDLRDFGHQDECFDIVIAIHVLEHIDGDTKAIKEVCRVLKPGGRFIVQVPYEKELTHNHVNLYTKGGLDAKLRRVGFRIKKLKANGQEFVEATKK